MTVLGFLGLLGLGLISLVPLTPIFLAMGWANIARSGIEGEWLRTNVKRLLLALCIFTFIVACILWTLKHSADSSIPVAMTICSIYVGYVGGNPLLFFIGLILVLSTLLIPAKAIRRRRIFVTLNVIVLVLWLLVPLWYLFGLDYTLQRIQPVYLFTAILSLLMSGVLVIASLRWLNVPSRRRAFLIISSIIVTLVISISIGAGLVGLIEAMAD
jgi:hypothetical protein